MKFNLFFESKYILVVRVQNFQDEFDLLTGKDRNVRINILQFAQDIWRKENQKDINRSNINIEEISINHVLSSKEKNERKLKWSSKETKYFNSQFSIDSGGKDKKAKLIIR